MSTKQMTAKRREQRRVACIASQSNTRARKFGVDGRISSDDVRAVVHGAASCAYCRSTARLTIDHIVSMSSGGPNIRANLQACCLACNTSKHQGDRPWRWSRTRDECIRCGRSDHFHCAHGLCRLCYQAAKRTERRMATL